MKIVQIIFYLGYIYNINIFVKLPNIIKYNVVENIIIKFDKILLLFYMKNINSFITY